MSATLSNGTTVSYSYDARGNRLSGSGPAVAYTVNDNNQLTSRTVGSAARGYGVSGKVAPGSQVKVFHPGAPQGEVLTAHPSTGVYEQWWGDPGAGVTRVELLVRGTKPGAGESGRDAVADQKVWVSLPLSSESYIYDGAGRLTEDGTWWYNWNALGQLTSLWRKPNAAPDPNVNTESISYSYDSDGRRTGRTRTVTYFDSTPALTETSKVLWEKWHPVMEERTLNGSALPRRWFVWGRDVSGSIGGAGGIGGLVSIKEEGGRTLLPMDDGLGNIIAVVDASSRAVLARYDYGPFGEIVSESGEVSACPFRFQSKWWDAAAGLNYFGYRHYNPKMGRWLSRDPLGEAGGFNLYAYCGNDPVNKWDFLGMDPELHITNNAADTAFINALGQPMVNYWEWAGGNGLAKGWNAVFGGEITTTAQVPTASELSRFFRQNGDGSWRVARYGERHDAFQSQFRSQVLQDAPEFRTTLNFINKVGAVGAVAPLLPNAYVIAQVWTGQGMAWWATGGSNTVAMWGTRAALGAGSGVAAYELANGVDPVTAIADGGAMFFNVGSMTGFGDPKLSMPKMPQIFRQPLWKTFGYTNSKAMQMGTVANPFGRAAAEELKVGSGNAYSVAYRMRMEVPTVPAGTRDAHFRAANRSLFQTLDADPAYANTMRKVIPDIDMIRGTASAPKNWVWKHSATEPGVMELVPAVQHWSPNPLWSLFHPLINGKNIGGFKIWGSQY